MASYSEALDRPMMKRQKKMLRSIEMRKAENGGVIVEHHFESMHPSEEHTFGPEQGHELASHIGKHMEMNLGGKAAEHEEMDEESE